MRMRKTYNKKTKTTIARQLLAAMKISTIQTPTYFSVPGPALCPGLLHWALSPLGTALALPRIVMDLRISLQTARICPDYVPQLVSQFWLSGKYSEVLDDWEASHDEKIGINRTTKNLQNSTAQPRVCKLLIAHKRHHPQPSFSIRSESALWEKLVYGDT